LKTNLTEIILPGLKKVFQSICKDFFSNLIMEISENENYVELQSLNEDCNEQKSKEGNLSVILGRKSKVQKMTLYQVF